MELVRKTTVAWLFQNAPSLPIFPLDRHAIEVLLHPQIVAVRISESLRERSVVAVYEDASALCTTSTFLKYAIYLYAGPGESTTVEVLRHRGCGFSFRIEREAILNAAQGLGSVAPSSLPYQMKIPEGMLSSYKAPERIEQENMISRAVDRLHSDKNIDDKLFILQNLSSTTSYDKVNRDAAYQMCEVILQNTSGILDMIVSILIACKEMSDDDISYQILNACLTIIANSMSALSEMNKPIKDVLTKTVADCKGLLNCLVTIVHECSCPHNTTLALTCFRLILENSTVANDIVNKKICDSVRDAKAIGEKTHRNLFLAAESTLAACSKVA